MIKNILKVLMLSLSALIFSSCMVQKWEGRGVANELKYNKSGNSNISIPVGVSDIKKKNEYNDKLYNSILQGLKKYEHERISYPQYYELVKSRRLEFYDEYSIKDGSNLRIGYIGNCGGYFELVSIWVVIPVFAFPVFGLNKCEKNGVSVFDKNYLDIMGVNVSLRYDNNVFELYDDGDGMLKLKVEDFKKFKVAKDKALIIKKGDFTKIVPFEWKTVYGSMSGIVLRGYEY